MPPGWLPWFTVAAARGLQSCGGDRSAARTWSLVWRRGEERAAVLAVVDAVTDEVGDLGIHRPDAWLPDSDHHKQ